MNSDLALKVLGEVMGWDNDRSRDEYAWLSLMARLKFDDYRDFRAGSRFVERLAAWLQQFSTEERETAYKFVRSRLVYIGPAEMKHLVELFFPEVVQPDLLAAVASELRMPTYLVWSRPDAVSRYEVLRRKCLFLSLSDGARMDDFRRANAGVISNEQVIPTLHIDSAKWSDLLKDLRKDVKDDTAKFRFIYVVDDFTGSGTSLIRYEVNAFGQKVWKGKLAKLWENIKSIIESHFDDDYTLCVHHYIASSQAEKEVRSREAMAKAERLASGHWFQHVTFSFGTILPENLPINDVRDPDFFLLTQGKYYDADLETNHTEEGGTKDVRLGFSACALPLVLEHNTPNNSVALIWAETQGKKGAPMRALFRRRQRHT